MRKNKSEFWNALKQLLLKKGLIDNEEILDLIAVYPILDLCVKGLSNKAISRILEEPIYEVTSVIQKYLYFDGFESTLDVQLDLWYNDLEDLFPEEEAKSLRGILDRFNTIERRIEEHYDKHP